MAAEIRLAIAGSKLCYAAESTAGTRPTTGYNMVPEVTDIPEMSGTSYDTIDMTPIDETEQHIEITGVRQSPGTLQFTANLSDTLLTFWNTTMMTAYETAVSAGKKMWFSLVINGMDKALFFTAEPKALAPSGGAVTDGWKCTLPLSLTNVPVWENKPTLAS
jgi:hypothetical protein